MKLNEEYEELKTDTRDVQITINSLQINIRNIDKEIFKTQ